MSCAVALSNAVLLAPFGKTGFVKLRIPAAWYSFL
jgi:hypothetical protein